MMKVAYTGWTWINNRDPEAAKRLLENSFRECKFLGYDYVENFAFIRDYYAENPQELVDLTKACNVNLVNLYGHFTFDVESALDIAKKQVKFLADIGGKWYNCQNAGFGDDGAPERPTNPEMIDKMCYIANTLGEYAKSLGVTVCFHPHYGTCVFSQSDIDYFAAHTNPEYVSFCFGHGTYDAGRYRSGCAHPPVWQPHWLHAPERRRYLCALEGRGPRQDGVLPCAGPRHRQLPGGQGRSGRKGL